VSVPDPRALDPAVTLVFCGMVLIMTLYSAGLARVAQQREQLTCAAYFVAFGSYAVIVSGSAPSFVGLPMSVLAPASGALAFFFGVRAFRALPRERSLWLGWGCVVLGSAASCLASLGWTSSSFLTLHGAQVGLVLQMVLLSGVLASKINAARAELRRASGALESELEAVSQALARAEDASQRAERATRIRDEFIATMSHEFRTPLNPIINIPQGLRAEFVRATRVLCGQCQAVFELEQDETVSDETSCPDCAKGGTLQKENVLSFAGDAARARMLLGKVEQSGEQLLRVVNGILDYSKMEARQLKLLYERFDVRALLSEVVSDLDEAAQRADIQLSLASEQRPLFTYADPHRIREVLVQLIDNAIKFRRGSGPVLVALREEGTKLSFSVTDQGIGIAKEHLESVFTSFEQVSKGNTRSHGGTGLGLSMARSLVQMHGGEISASSELGVGSTFRFWIPRGLSARGSMPERKRLSVGARA